MKRARFVAAARREFLAEVAYYRSEEPGLAARFVEAVEEAVTRALAFPLAGSPSTIPARRSALSARRNIRDLRTDGGITRIARESELR